MRSRVNDSVVAAHSSHRMAWQAARFRGPDASSQRPTRTNAARIGSSVDQSGPLVPLRLVPVVAVAVCAAAIASAASATQPDLRVGFVAFPGWQPNRESINGLLYLGFVQAVRLPGVSGRVVDVPPSGDGSTAMLFLLRQKYEVIVTPFAPIDQFESFARLHPRTTFLLPDAPPGRRVGQGLNALSTAFHAEEGAYLAGYLAARMVGRSRSEHVVSSVGGLSVPAVNRLIAGFEAGARAGDPTVRLLRNYAGTFGDPAKCAAVARDQLARGSRAVFNVAGPCGRGALVVASRNNVFGIGVDVDQSSLGRAILTSVLKREDVAMVAAIRSIRRGTFSRTGEMVFDLANHGVDLGKISLDVPPNLRAGVARLRARIISGKVVVPTVITKTP
jgi:basic membrane protein A